MSARHPFAAVFLLCFCRTAIAQIPTAPVPVASAVKTGIAAPALNDLTTAHNSGDWKNLQRLARAALEKVPVPPLGAGARRQSVVLLWAGKDVTGEDALLWTLVHDRNPDAYTTVLPGLSGNTRLYEVYLSDDPGAGLSSYYFSTHVDDPLFEQIPAVAEAVAGPLFSLLGAVGGVLRPNVRALPPAAQQPPRVVYAWVRQVSLPMRRADVKAHYRASEPVTVEEFGAAADELQTRLRYTEISHDQCSRELAVAMAAAARKVAEKACAPALPADTDERRTAKATACVDAFDQAFETEYRHALSTCGPGAERAALREVNLEFRKLATNWSPAKLKADVKFANRPLTHFGFGALSSIAFSGKTNEPRAQVDDGAIVEDPLPRPLTAVVLNYNVTGYNAESSRVRLRERVNLFGGATMTPEFGLTGGVNVVLVRGLGVNVGYALLFHATKREADVFGEAPSDPLDPLRLANVGVWYAGLSYNFK